MSAHVTIDRLDAARLRIELRQKAGEVVRFALFVALILVGLYVLTPKVRDDPGWLIGLAALAVAWSAFALSAREVYVFDSEAGTIEAHRHSVLGHRRRTLTAGEVTVVRAVIGGVDDNRQLVELVNDRGKVRLRLPARITTLGASDQMAVCRAIAEQLGVRLH